MNRDIFEKLSSFFTKFKSTNLKKGENLLRADEVPAGVYFLQEGLVKQYFLTHKGDEFIVNVFKSGSFFPMPWAINNIKNTFYFEASTDAKVFIAPKEKAVSFLKDNPDVMFDLLSRIYRGIDGVFLKMAYMMSGDAYERLVNVLLIHAKRFGKEENGQIKILINEKDLSNQIGIRRETVSRQLKKLKEKNLAVFDKGEIIIPNLQRFEAELF